MVNMKFKQILSIVATFVVLTLLINWKLAVLFTIGIGFHELCHLWAARFVKLETDGFYLIPFIGGLAFIKDKYKTYRQQIFVFLMGPVGGGAMAALSAIAYYVTGYIYFAAAAEWLFIINIFNLIPLSFLDGGQIMNAITYSISNHVGVYSIVISTILAIAIVGYLNPVLAGFIFIFGAAQVWDALSNLKAVEEGKPWLARESWIMKPKLLSVKEIIITICIYAMVIGVMSYWCYQLSLIPNANIGYIIGK